MNDLTYRQATLDACNREPRISSWSAGVISKGVAGLRLVPGPEQPRESFPEWAHAHLLKRDGDLCAWGDDCLRRDRRIYGDDYQIDHAVPRSKGGYHVPFNWQLMHPECNNRKNGHLSLDIERPTIVKRRYESGDQECFDAGDWQAMHCRHGICRCPQGTHLAVPVSECPYMFCHCVTSLTLRLVLA